MDKTMICSLSSYGSKFLIMSIAISSLPYAAHADLRQQVNMEKTREQSSEQCREKIRREALFGNESVWGFMRIVGNSIYEVQNTSMTPACSWKWTKRAEIGVERIYNPEYIKYLQMGEKPLREVWHIDRSDICRYYDEPGYSKIKIICYDLRTGDSRIRY